MAHKRSAAEVEELEVQNNLIQHRGLVASKEVELEPESKRGTPDIDGESREGE
jgi:hypothetical protein